MILSKKQHKLDTLAKEILTKVDDLILICDLDFQPIDANKKFLEKFGFEKIEHFFEYNTSIRELFFWEKLSYLNEQEWKNYLKNNKNYHVKVKDTKRVYDYHINCYLSKDKENYILLWNDVTEIYRSMETIKEFERLKSDFLANISHEFRTPMNGILGFLELFYYTDLSAKQKEYLSMINRSSKVLLSNIEALLDYSQLQSGALKLNPKNIDLISLIEQVVKNYAPLVFEGKKHFYTFIDPAIPKEVMIDERKIRQILQALIDNAIKFTSASESIIVDVRLLNQQSDGSVTLNFIVRDNGVGIDTSKLSQLLQPFSSEGKADKRLGLGLSLASGLISLFGSKLEVKSALSKGSEFSFVIKTQASLEKKFKKVEKKSAIVVEVEKSQRNYANILALYLQAIGYKVAKVDQIQKVPQSGIDLCVVTAKGEEKLQNLNDLKKKVHSFFLFVSKDATISKHTMQQFDALIYEPLLPTKLYDTFVKGIDLHLYTQKTSQPKTPKQKQLEVLVVEDNLINQKLLKTILEEKGIKVYLADDGVEAVEMAEKRTYDLIFMDIDLPRKNGVEATKEIKKYSKYNKQTPIIAQTAMAMDGDKERLLAEGLDGYIPKPLQREALNMLLENLNVY